MSKSGPANMYKLLEGNIALPKLMYSRDIPHQRGEERKKSFLEEAPTIDSSVMYQPQSVLTHVPHGICSGAQQA